jgi:predicted NAD/FAD-dependent oxidoreductase
MTHARVAVIGAGLTGLTCARRLQDAGFTVRAFDKGRGLGGRLASRRADGGLRFDHGATYVETIDPDFTRVLERARAEGCAARLAWPTGETKYVGLPGMSALVRPTAAGLDIRKQTQVSALDWTDGGWHLSIDGAEGLDGFDLVVLTVPAPQAKPLAAGYPALVAALDAVDFDPCWALLAAFDGSIPAPNGRDSALPSSLDKLSIESAKPGRDATALCLVAHASPEWSQAHLEHGRDAVAPLLLAEVRRAYGPVMPEPHYLAAHRWRYARVKSILARPYLASPDHRLFIGGDWCLGNSAEHAYASGSAIADAVLGTLVDRRQAS